MVVIRIDLLLLIFLLRRCFALGWSSRGGSSRRQIIVESAGVIGTASIWAPGRAVAATKKKTINDPFVYLPNVVRTQRRNSANLPKFPKISYSLYKTPADQVLEGVRLALDAGVEAFDCASLYGTNEYVAQALRSSNKRVYIAHKLSNTEQSRDKSEVYRTVIQQLNLFHRDSLDLVMIHSPLTDVERRLTTYDALIDLQQKGLVKAVGVCHYGIVPLNEIVENSLPPPSVIQQVLSPFNQRAEVQDWAVRHGSLLSCSAWSKLSSVQGPQQEWAIVADIAQKKNVTKQQILIRWALQKGFLCAPRSGSKFKIERQAIAENSWKECSKIGLNAQEMGILDSLDVNLSTGRLGIVDGWEETEIVNEKWDPTLVI